jgi:hypothetical protein
MLTIKAEGRFKKDVKKNNQIRFRLLGPKNILVPQNIFLHAFRKKRRGEEKISF